MKIKDLNGKTHNWSLTNNKQSHKSGLHLIARELISSKFPCIKILEEVFLPGIGLYADFYIPMLKIMIEVHGEQHYKYNDFFHKTPLDFKKQLKRDLDKKQWCEINGITLIELPYFRQKDWGELLDE